MSSCLSVCVSSVVCPSCVCQQLVYTFFVGSYLFNALTYQVHIWCEDSLGQQLQIAYMYIGVRGQSQRTNRLFSTKYVTFPPSLIFMCTQHLNGLSYPIYICFAYNLGPSVHISWSDVKVKGHIVFYFMSPYLLSGFSCPIHFCCACILS